MFSWLTIGLLIKTAAFVVVSSGVMLITCASSRRGARINRRFADLFRSETSLTIDRRLAGIRGGLFGKLLVSSSVTEISERLLTDNGAARSNLKSRLSAAGLYDDSSLATFCTVKVFAVILPLALGLAAIVLGATNLNRGLLFGGVAAAVGAVAPGLWLDRRKDTRQRLLRRSLPDFLDLMVACLEGGMSFGAGLFQVSDELRVAHPLLTQELTIVRREAELGTPLDVAIEHFAQRTALDAIGSLAAFVQQSQRFGTAMGDAMRELSEMLRTQREQRAEEMAHKAAVKVLLPTLFFIFPAIFVVLAGPAAIKLQQAFGKESAADGTVAKPTFRSGANQAAPRTGGSHEAKHLR